MDLLWSLDVRLHVDRMKIVYRVNYTVWYDTFLTFVESIKLSL